MSLPPELRLDPFPFYARMRHEEPVAFDPLNQAWNVYRYEDARRVVSDAVNFSSRRNQNPRATAELAWPSLLTTDPPRHKQLRELVSRAFTPRSVANLEPRIVAIAGELLDAVIAQ